MKGFLFIKNPKCFQVFKSLITVFFVACFLILSSPAKACDNCTWSLISKTKNADNSVDYELEINIELGGGDGAYYGFALVFTAASGNPSVTSFPTQLTTANLMSGALSETLKGYTGIAVNTEADDSDWIKYKLSNALTYESFNSAASNDFKFKLKFTLSSCADTIILDAHVNFDSDECRYKLAPGPCTSCTADIAPSSNDVCQGDTVFLASGISGTQGANPIFNWTSASGLSVLNANQSASKIKVGSGQAAGNYIVNLNYKDDNGCDINKPDTFKVNNLPTIGGDLTICLGDTSQLTGSGTPAAASAWTSSSSNISINASGKIIGNSLGKSAITYKDDKGCSISDTAVVGPPDTASVAITSTSSIVCPNDTITFTATPVNGGTAPSYQWKVNGLNQGTNSATFKSSTLSAGDYVKVVMTSNAKCVAGSPATSFQITLSSTAGTVTISSNKDTICKGDTILFSANPSDSSAVTSYQWKLNGNNVGNNSSKFSTAAVSAGDSIWVEIGVNSSCGAGSIISNKLKPVVNAIPIISATITNVSCSGFNDGAALIGANGGKPNYFYSKDGINFQPQNSFDNLTAGNYTFVVKDQNACKAKIDTAVAAPPPITFVVDPDSAIICFGDSVKITAIGYSSFNWFNQTAGIKVDSNKTTIKAAPTISSIYKVVSTICGVSDSVKITVLDPVTIDPISDKTLCVGDTISIKPKANGGKGIFTYTWIPTPAFSSATGDSVAVIASSTAPISFLLKAKNECPGYALNFKVFINPLPSVEVQSVNELCAGELFLLSNILHNSKIVDYNWDFGDSEKATAKITASHAYKNSGNYQVYLTVKDSNNCINSDTSAVIKVNETPKGIITYVPEEDINTNTIVLFSAAKSSGQVKAYYWEFENKGTSTKVDTAFSFSEAGNYKVTLVVSNDKCADTTQKILKVVNDFALFVPSSFSPNNDGVNDIFIPKGFGVIDYNLQIWNNWGELIFETTDFGKGWDGNIANGSQKASQEVYVYKIKYKALGQQNEAPLEKSGHLTLFR